MSTDGPKFDLVFDDGAITALLDRVDRGAQNAFKRGLRAALKVFREGAAAYAGARGYPARWRNPNRGYRTSVDTRLTYEGPAAVKTESGWARNKSRKSTGFRILGKLFSGFPGAVYEYGQKEHWVKMTPALIRWAKRHGLAKKLIERQGLWLYPRGKEMVGSKPTRKAHWVKKLASGKSKFYGKRWYATFARNPRLEAWAKRHGLTTKTAFHVSQQPPRPFVKPGAGQHSDDARSTFKDVILSWLEKEKHG